MRKSRTRVALGAILALLLFAAVAYAAGNNYSGKTSQGNKCKSPGQKPCTISFNLGKITVNGQKLNVIKNFRVRVADKCPDGHLLIVGSTYPDMLIKNGKFGGSFFPNNPFAGEKSTISGKIKNSGKVTGTIKDTSHSLRENRLCNGKATWSLKGHK
jgi:hypothetical protein